MAFVNEWEAAHLLGWRSGPYLPLPLPLLSVTHAEEAAEVSAARTPHVPPRPPPRLATLCPN
eukprot:525266-Prymnesium_polylepis.1